MSPEFIYLIAWILFGSFFGWMGSKIAEVRGRNPTLWFMLIFISTIIGIAILYLLPALI
jgi:biotin transporter BioY